jgi:hypothetical protein
MTYKDEAIAVESEIISEGYYTHIYFALKEKKKFILTEANDVEINNFFNEFWFALPDNKSIRTPTFFKVCDICERTGE